MVSIVEEVVFYVEVGKKVFEDLGLIVEELDVVVENLEEIMMIFKKNDFIYVIGGNIFFLL